MGALVILVVVAGLLSLGPAALGLMVGVTFGFPTLGVAVGVALTLVGIPGWFAREHLKDGVRYQLDASPIDLRVRARPYGLGRYVSVPPAPDLPEEPVPWTDIVRAEYTEGALIIHRRAGAPIVLPVAARDPGEFRALLDRIGRSIRGGDEADVPDRLRDLTRRSRQTDRSSS